MKLTDRQQQIIDESIKLIANKGIQSLTIKNISAAIGVSEPAVYRHFENKSAIIMGILESFCNISSDVLAELVMTDISCLEKVERFIMDRLSSCERQPDLAKVMFSEECFQHDSQYAEKILEIMHGHKFVVQKLLKEGQSCGEIRSDIDSLQLFRIIFGGVRLLIKQWTMTGYRFCLTDEGQKLWKNILLLIKC